MLRIIRLKKDDTFQIDETGFKNVQYEEKYSKTCMFFYRMDFNYTRQKVKKISNIYFRPITFCVCQIFYIIYEQSFWKELHCYSVLLSWNGEYWKSAFFVQWERKYEIERNKKGPTLSSLEDEILTQLIVFFKRNHSGNNNTTAGMLEICNVCSLRNNSCYFITKISNKGKVNLFLLINLSSAVSCPNDQLIFVVILRYQLLMENLIVALFSLILSISESYGIIKCINCSGQPARTVFHPSSSQFSSGKIFSKFYIANIHTYSSFLRLSLKIFSIMYITALILESILYFC